MGYQMSTLSCRLFAGSSLSVLLGAWIYAVYPILNRVFNAAVVEQKYVTKSIAIMSIICFSAYLIYRKRFKLKRAHYSTSTLAILALVCLQLGYILGVVYKLNSVELTAIILMLPALVLLCYGPQVLETIFFPVLYFLLIIPLLQKDFQYDTYLYWFAMSLGYGYIHYKNFWRRSMLAITAVLSPFVMQSGFLHSFFKYVQFPYREWLPFILSVLGVFFVAHVLKEPRRVFISAISPLEFERSENGLQNKMRHWVIATLLVAISLSFMPRLIGSIENSYWARQDTFALIKEKIWEGPRIVTGDVWKPIFLNASRIHQSLYVEGANFNKFDKSFDQNTHKQNMIYLAYAYYAPDLSSALLLEDKNHFYNPRVWNKVASNNLKINLMNQKRLYLIENVVEVKGIQRLIWSWYDVRGFTLQPQPHLFYLIDLINYLSRQQAGSAVVVLSTPLTESVEASRARLHLFLEEQYRGSALFFNIE